MPEERFIDPETIMVVLAVAMTALLLAYLSLCGLQYRRQGWQGRRTLLLPGQRLMQSMSLLQKFMLIGLLAMAPALLAFSQVLAVNNHELQKIGNERVGVRHIRNLMPLLEMLARHRGMMHVFLLGNHAYKEDIAAKKQEIDGYFGQHAPGPAAPGLAAAHRRWQVFQQKRLGLTVEQCWDMQTEIIDGLLASMTEIGRGYRLFFDSHPGRHYLMSIFLEQLPVALGAAGQIRGLGAGIVAGAGLTGEQRLLLAGLSARLRQSGLDIGRNLKLAYRYNSGLEKRLAGRFSRYRSDIENMLFVLEHNLTRSRSINTLYFIDNNLSTSPKDFFSLATRVISSGMLLSASSIEAFSRSLDAHSSRLEAMEEAFYYAYFFCLALVVWLFYLFYSSTRTTVSSLQQLAIELRKGNINHGITAHGRDEIFAMVNVFDDIARTLVQTIELRRASEKELLKLSRAVEQTTEGVLITDRDGVVEYANRAYKNMFGFAETGTLPAEPLHPAVRAVEGGSSVITMTEIMAAGSTWQGETVVQGKNGRSIPVYCTVNPVCDADGEIIHFIFNCRDMSEQKQIEEKAMLSQKMESVGTLAGGIAHDFNNALQGISGHLYLAERYGDPVPKTQAHIAEARKLVDRSAAMVRQLMTFARHEPARKEAIAFVPFLREAIELSRVSIPASIRLDISLPDDSGRIIGDTTQLQQIVMNMLNNARDAVMEAPDPTISLCSETVVADRFFLQNHPNVRPGRYFRLSVSDNGCGIAEDDIRRIFEPFYTTKSVGQGTGLGLAMVFTCMRSHEGAIDVVSKPGEGSTFHLYFRMDENRAELPAPAVEQGVVRGRRETILLADDDATIRDTGRAVLENLDYRVLIAEDGCAAVEIYRAFRHEIDLVILDLVMPRLGGIDAAARMRAICGDVQVCFATGYDLEGSICGELPCPAGDVIYKPFSVHEFSRFVRERLKRSGKPVFGSRIFDKVLKLRRSTG